jgi:DNA modification methylase
VKPYYERGGITLYCADNRDVLPELDAGSIDLVFTSPPYNLGVTSGGGFPSGLKRDNTRHAGGKWANAALALGYGAHDDAMPYPEYVAWQKETLTACWRLLTERGAIFYNHKPRVQDGLLQTPLDLNPGLPVRQIVIWQRAGGMNFSPTFYCPTHEWIVILAKPAFGLKSRGASGVGDVWTVPQEGGTPHPAPFPVALPLRALETTSTRVALDPFAGSGTTLVAAKMAGIPAIGIELEERYCEIAARRLQQEVLDFGAEVPA